VKSKALFLRFERREEEERVYKKGKEEVERMERYDCERLLEFSFFRKTKKICSLKKKFGRF